MWERKSGDHRAVSDPWEWGAVILTAARGEKILLVDASGSEVQKPQNAEFALLTSLAKTRCYPWARAGRTQKSYGITALYQPCELQAEGSMGLICAE